MIFKVPLSVAALSSTESLSFKYLAKVFGKRAKGSNHNLDYTPFFVLVITIIIIVIINITLDIKLTYLLTSSIGVSSFSFFAAKCFFRALELTVNPTREKMASAEQNIWKDLIF